VRRSFINNFLKIFTDQFSSKKQFLSNNNTNRKYC